MESDQHDKPCPHENWRVMGNEFTGSCTCLDCGEQFPICDAFNYLRDRMLDMKSENMKHPFDDFPYMKLHAGCSECGGELEIKWKSAYTSSNSLGIKVKPCSQCCVEEQTEDISVDLTPQRPATPDTKNYPDESEVK